MPLSQLYVTKGYTLLATPVAITTATSGSWQTVNNATLNGLMAASALLSHVLTAEADSNNQEGVEIHLRQTGSGLAMSNATRRGWAMSHGGYGGMGYNDAYASGDVVTPVNLDASYDFDYYINLVGTPASWSVTTYLIGYRLP